MNLDTRAFAESVLVFLGLFALGMWPAVKYAPDNFYIGAGIGSMSANIALMYFYWRTEK